MRCNKCIVYFICQLTFSCLVLTLCRIRIRFKFSEKSDQDPVKNPNPGLKGTQRVFSLLKSIMLALKKKKLIECTGTGIIKLTLNPTMNL